APAPVLDDDRGAAQGPPGARRAMSRLAEIVQKRERLAARSDEQRREIVETLAGCSTVLSVADRGLALGRWARDHPIASAVAIAALVGARRRLGWRGAVRALALWRTGRYVLDLVGTYAEMRGARAEGRPGRQPGGQS